MKSGLLIFLAIVLAACSSQTTPTPLPPTPTPGATAILPTATPGLPTPTPSPTPLPYPAAARLGEGVIYLPEVESGQRQIESALQATGLTMTPEQQRARALAALVEEELLAQAAWENGFTLSEAEFETTYETLAASTPGGLEAWLSSNALPGDLFVESLRRSIAAAWMRDQIAAAIPAEAEQARARQVVVATREEAQQILEQARQPGADFTALAYQFDPYTGGDLGWFARGTLFFPQIEEAVFGLPDAPDGQAALSEVTQTPLGFHVLQRSGRATRPLARSARLTLQRQALRDWLTHRRTALGVDLPALEALPAAQVTDSIPRYPVQEGDNYYSMAQRLRVAVQALIDANPDFPPEGLSTGSELLIPGVSGSEGRVAAIHRPPGIPTLSLARAVGMSDELLARLNRLTSPLQIYENAALLAPESLFQHAQQFPVVPAGTVRAGGLALENALQTGQSPWLLALASGLESPGRLLPEDTFFLPAGSAPAPVTLPLDTQGLQLVQGATLALRVNPPDLQAAPTGAVPTGTLDDFSLHFFPVPGGWVALQGLPAMGEPGLALLDLQIPVVGGFEMALPFYPGDFPQDPPRARMPLGAIS